MTRTGKAMLAVSIISFTLAACGTGSDADVALDKDSTDTHPSDLAIGSILGAPESQAPTPVTGPSLTLSVTQNNPYVENNIAEAISTSQLNAQSNASEVEPILSPAIESQPDTAPVPSIDPEPETQPETQLENVTSEAGSSGSHSGSVTGSSSEPSSAAAFGGDSLAFPGAMGWAADTTAGGRGGKVVVVNSLSNVVDPTDSIMTFREAMTEIDEPRTIVFSVAGLIDYRSGTTVPNSHLKLNHTDSSVTVACQSAPPPGITLMGDGLVFAGYTKNVIMRHCRLRNSDPQSVSSATNSSCVRIHGTSPSGTGETQRDYIFDHMSCMWSADDSVSFGLPGISPEQGDDMQNMSLSNSIVAEGDADSLHDESNQIPNRYLHAMGPGCASVKESRTVRGCSMVANLIAHNSRRNGRFWGVDGGEIINNIIYNPHEVGITVKARPGHINYVDGYVQGNLIQMGPTSKTSATPIDLGGNNVSNSYVRVDGNFLGQYRSDSVEPYDDVPGSNNNSPKTPQASPVQDIVSMAQQGSDHMRCVGASRPRRDSHDQRVVDEYHEQSGQVGIMSNHERDYSEYNTTAIFQNWADSDQDGMPDTWESKMEISNPVAFDLSDDYTNLEVFLNAQAECPNVILGTESLSFPGNSDAVTIPYETNWLTWDDGQSLEICVNDVCDLYTDTLQSGEFTATGLANGLYTVRITPVGADGIAEKISASIEVSVGN